MVRVGSFSSASSSAIVVSNPSITRCATSLNVRSTSCEKQSAERAQWHRARNHDKNAIHDRKYTWRTM
jgi:hypothetical protein